jgi:hypothetical protein
MKLGIHFLNDADLLMQRNPNCPRCRQIVYMQAKWTHFAEGGKNGAQDECHSKRSTDRLRDTTHDLAREPRYIRSHIP